MLSRFLLLLTSAFLLLIISCQRDPIDQNWEAYQGGIDANQYSNLDQINRQNVTDLEVAWVYHTGDLDTSNRSQIQCNPLIIDGVLFGTSPQLKLFALDARTGEEIWVFDPFNGEYDQFGMGVNRGLGYWSNGTDTRILYTAGPFLYAINAKNGELYSDFGQAGKVDLHDGLDRDVTGLYISSNTPGVVFEDLYILGSRVSESIGHVPGHIRAYDVKTGEIKWIFHTIPHPGEFGSDTWPENAYLINGGANAWSGMSLDAERGVVYIPTGSPSFDYYGGDRPGNNLFGNCILALDARTGERKWHYQVVRHDLWDRDLPAPPNLTTIEVDGQKRDVVAQITKNGYVFVLDRDTGIPIFPMEEVEVLPSSLDGEWTAESQPLPLKPPSFTRQTITQNDLPVRSKEAFEWADSVWQISQKNHPFQPLAEKTSLLFPGLDGGGEWGGAAVDAQGVMYVNASQMAWMLSMKKFEQPANKKLATTGKLIYDVLCQSCHGTNLQGTDLYANIPELVNIKERQTPEQSRQIIKNGKGVMPGFSTLKDNEINALIAFLHDQKWDAGEGQSPSFWPYPYQFAGFNRFNAPDGYPAIKPPWGLLSAIDLNQGELLWQSILGDHPEVRAEGEPKTGTENYGGPIVTEGDLVFIAATKDSLIRAFDRFTGEELWSHQLNVPGYATPATYSVSGTQYIVIAAGGGKIGSPSGDAYYAFRLMQ